MGVLQDLRTLLRHARSRPRPSLAEGLSTAASGMQDTLAMQDALTTGTVGPQNGVPGRAVVVALDDVAPGAVDPGRGTSLRIRVEVPGVAPILVAHVETVPADLRPWLTVGSVLPLWALRAMPTRFTIDWDGARATRISPR